MFSHKSTGAMLVILALVSLSACDLLDPVRPTPQPDTEVFGNLLGVEQLPDQPGTWVATVRVGVPRVLSRAEEASGKAAPEMEEGITAEVTVNHDTVVLLADNSSTMDEFNPGTEVVAIPVPGTTMMMGSNRVVLGASYLMDFETYRRWRLPRLKTEGEAEALADITKINSAGVEQAPVPLAGGTVLYFSARLRPPGGEGEGWQGAERDGVLSDGDEPGLQERSYRTELGPEGWSEPALVHFPGVEGAVTQRVSWVNEAEDRCLVTVIEAQQRPWVGSSEKTRSGWSEPRKLEELGEDAADAVYLAGSSTMLTFVSGRGGGRQTDLFLYDWNTEDEALPLEPKVNSLGSEWGPRVGTDNELFFTRGDRQMVLVGGSLSDVRLPGPHRSMISQVAPTRDGQWMFFCLSKLRPAEPDQDIWVARWYEDKSLGVPVPVDEWRK